MINFLRSSFHPSSVRLGKIKFFSIFLLISLLLQDIAAQQYDTFEKRAAYIIASLTSAYPEKQLYFGDDDVKTAMGFALARLYSGKDEDKAISMIERMQLKGLDMFDKHQNIDAYLRFGHRYPQKLRETVKKVMTSFDYHVNGTTENHKLMFKTAGYLVAQTFPDWEKADETLIHCREELYKEFTRTVNFGIKEYDSPTYGTFYITCMLSLLEFARDPEMKQKALMTMETHLISLASEWLKGYHISSTLRSYSFVQSPQFTSPYFVLGWLYFGNSNPPVILNRRLSSGELYNPEGWFSALAAISTYRMPVEILNIAGNRTSPFVNLESQDMDPESQLNFPYGFKKYSYITPNYGLASQWDGNSLGWSAQMRRWKLTWVSDSNASTFFVTHPAAYKGSAEKLIGATSREQVLQHRGSLLAIYNIQSGEPYPYITGPVPKSSILETIQDSSGWTFFHGGSVLFAVRFAKKFSSSEEMTFRGEKHKMLKSEFLKNGFILETSSPERFKANSPWLTLDKFRQEILKNTRVDFSAIDTDENPAFTYHSLDGDNLEIKFGEYRKVNGKEIDYSVWPLVSNPWLHQDIKGRFLVLTFNDKARVYDFKEWKIYEAK